MKLEKDDLVRELFHNGMELKYTDSNGVERIGKTHPLVDKYSDGKIPMNAQVCISSGSLDEGNIDLSYALFYDVMAALGFPPENKLRLSYAD